MLKGIAVSGGVVIGKAFVLDREALTVPRRAIGEKDVPKEILRFEDALSETRKRIIEVQNKITEAMGTKHGEIFNAYLLILEDRMLIEEVIERVKKEKLAVECIFLQVLKQYSEVLSRIDDEYLRERAKDITDLGRRVLRNLIGQQKGTLSQLEEDVIVVAYDLSPSDTALMHKERVIGFATDIGSRTSHTAIMARALEIPAVVGLKEITRITKDGDNLIIDGNEGVVIVNPDRDAILKYRRKRGRFEKVQKGLLTLKDLPSVTRDERKVTLAANIELPEDVDSVVAHGAEGVGLFRTEYIYMNRRDLPTEDEHYNAYKSVAEKVAPYPVIIRTMDLGGDKFLSHLDITQEMNPFMGWRAIRFCLARPDIFKTQLRAILRASNHKKNLKIMYPMISGLEELIQANNILNDVKEELRRKNIPFDEGIPAGAMIEIPSAAITADLLAKEAKFFSIGTNDLIQYSLAVDRVNEKIAYLYEPAHPAVVRLIKNIIETGHAHNIWVGMCGEMAGEPAMALLLLGLGLDEFSTSPISVPKIKKVIRSVSLSDAVEVAREAIKLPTGREIENFLRRKLKELVPDIEK